MIHRSSLKTLDKEKPVIWGSVTSCNYSQYHNITGHDRKTNILIQSPLTTIVNKNRNWLTFKFSIAETKHRDFLDKLNELSHKIQVQTQKRYHKTIHFDEPNIVGNTATLYGNIVNGCKIYNADGSISKESPSKTSAADFIFCVSQVQISNVLDDTNDGLYGRILFEIVQVRLHKINAEPLVEYNFDSKTKTKMNTTIENPKHSVPDVAGYEKYFRMLKMGIPKHAVQQRMKVEGADPEVLDGKVPSTKPKVQTKLFDASQLQTTQLKKTEIVERKQPKGGIGLGLSLVTIQSALSGLRKTRFLPFGT